MYDIETIGEPINGIMGMLIALWAVLFAILVIRIIANWMVYKKMGQAGWKAIVPFYSDFVLADTVHSRKMAIWYVALEVALFVLQFFQGLNTTVLRATCHNTYYDYGSASAASELMGQGMVLSLLLCGVSIAFLVISIIIYNRLSKGFGHGPGFTVGLVLLGCVFFPILGFSKSEQFDAKRLLQDDNSGSDGNDTAQPSSES